MARPEVRELSDRFAEARVWIRTLEEGSKAALGAGYEVVYAEVNHRQLGTNRVPQALVIPTEEDALALVGKRRQADVFDPSLCRGSRGGRSTCWNTPTIGRAFSRRSAGFARIHAPASMPGRSTCRACTPSSSRRIASCSRNCSIWFCPPTPSTLKRWACRPSSVATGFVPSRSRRHQHAGRAVRLSGFARAPGVHHRK